MVDYYSGRLEIGSVRVAWLAIMTIFLGSSETDSAGVSSINLRIPQACPCTHHLRLLTKIHIFKVHDGVNSRQLAIYNKLKDNTCVLCWHDI